MAKFTTLSSHVVALPRDNVDTDQIIPARFLKVTDKKGLGDQLFSDWRYFEDGKPNPDFPLNFESSVGAQVLLAGRNFGSGSSREHAPWALCGWGLKAIIALSFADIFRNNALKNGLLPIVVDEKTHKSLLSAVEKDPSSVVNIDLEAQSLTLPDGSSVNFPIDDFSKHCLLQGIDQLEYILSFEAKINEYEAALP